MWFGSVGWTHFKVTFYRVSFSYTPKREWICSPLAIIQLLIMATIKTRLPGIHFNHGQLRRHRKTREWRGETQKEREMFFLYLSDISLHSDTLVVLIMLAYNNKDYRFDVKMRLNIIENTMEGVNERRKGVKEKQSQNGGGFKADACKGEKNARNPQLA